MIDPSNTYVGLGAFYNPNAYWPNATAGEFSSSEEMDETQNAMAGECIQTIEVKDSFISLNISLKKINIEAKEETQAEVSAEASSCPVSIMGNVNWSSSNEKVATVNQNGKITGVDYGTATITAKNGTLSQSVTINVTTHDWSEQKELSQRPTCEKPGKKVFKCKVCDATNTETIPATGHQNKEVKHAKVATCTTTGYTGDTYCNTCGKQLSKGTVILAKSHNWDAGKVTQVATYTQTGIKTYTCKACGTRRTKTIDKITMPKVGTIYTIAGNQYKITKAGAEVSLVKANPTVKSINIPATIKVNGLTYKVTAIAAKAFKQNKKLQSVTVGENVKSISKNTFFKCSSLKKVNLKTALLTNKTAGKNAFKGVNKKLRIKVPKKVKKYYKKIFKGLKVK